MHGSMNVGMHGAEFVVRIGPSAAKAVLARGRCVFFDILRRPMRGWLPISTDATSDVGLKARVDEALTRARSLPSK